MMGRQIEEKESNESEMLSNQDRGFICLVCGREVKEIRVKR